MAEERTRLLDDPRWERWAGTGGIVFVVLSVAWALIVRRGPDATESDQAILGYFADAGNRGELYIAAILLGFAGVFFLWFLGSLRTVLVRAEGDPSRLTAVAFAAGVVMTGIMFVKNTVTVTLATASDVDAFQLDPDTSRLLDVLTLGLIAHEAVAGAVLVGAASVVILRTGVLPSWLGWAGALTALVAAFALPLFGLPLVLVALWVLAVSVYLLRGAGAEPASP